MEKLSFKTFVWPQNPHTYREEGVREPVFEKNDAGEDVFKCMGPRKRTIIATGAFFGSTAFASYRTLAELLEEASVGELKHPLWGVRNCYLTGLELTQEPRENYVAYQVTFQQADADGILAK